MERMRQQISSLLNRFPLAKGGNATEGIFPGGFENAGFPSISGIDLSKGNTTSITKVSIISFRMFEFKTKFHLH